MIDFDIQPYYLFKKRLFPLTKNRLDRTRQIQHILEPYVLESVPYIVHTYLLDTYCLRH